MKTITRPIFLVSVTAFWLTMMSLYLYRQYFTLTPIIESYKILPIMSSGIREEHQAIYLADQRVGLNFITLIPLAGESQTPPPSDTAPVPGNEPASEEKPAPPPEPAEDVSRDMEYTGEDAYYQLNVHSYLKFQLLGKTNEMLIRAKAWLDRNMFMRAFGVRISSNHYSTNIQGQVTKTILNLVIEDKDSPPVRKIVDLGGPVFFSESLDVIWIPENLVPGKRGQVRVWNPLLSTVETIHFQVLGKDTLDHLDKKTDVFVVELKRDENITRAWITPEGVTLKKESPLGLVYQREPAWQIYDHFRETADAAFPDLPNLFSVPASGIQIKDPGKLTELKVKIKVAGTEQTTTIVKDNLDNASAQTWDTLPVSPEITAYLTADEYIQSEDPALLAAAKEIAGNEPSPLGAARKLMTWVHGHMQPEPTVSVPSARQVLDVRKGDCNEYAVLFTALARALKIPAKPVAGLLYYQGRFYYHAWVEVFLGEWITLDPTLNQLPVDVTHIALVEGTLQDQVALTGQIGKINLEILESK